MRRRLAALLAPAVLAAAGGAQAAGGAHVVDDADVETPGVCHLETWVGRVGPRAGLVNLAPACTRKAWPRIELGAAAQHAWSREGDVTVAGPALKATFGAPTDRARAGVATAAAWNLESGRLETAGLTVPLTLDLDEARRASLNLGWQYSHADRRHEAFVGAQMEIALPRDLTAMAEVIARGKGASGGQIGLRWTPNGGDRDLDLLLGRGIDGTDAVVATLGLTLRR